MFDKKYIEEITELLCKNELSEIYLKDGEKEISIRKDATSVSTSAAPIATQVPVAAQKTASDDAAAPINKGRAITSPMVGTFYKSPSTDAKPFIEIGSTVKEGQVVCIIEAMKLMNEIEADVSGKVVEICVEDGQPVEFGQVLIYVE